MGNDIHAYRYLCMLKVSLLYENIIFPSSGTKI